jgi:hypothetical protein
LLYAGEGNDGLATDEIVEVRIEGLKLGCPRLDQSIFARKRLREKKERM